MMPGKCDVLCKIDLKLNRFKTYVYLCSEVKLSKVNEDEHT